MAGANLLPVMVNIGGEEGLKNPFLSTEDTEESLIKHIETAKSTCLSFILQEDSIKLTSIGNIGEVDCDIAQVDHARGPARGG